MASAPVLLVTDIDRGGAFAWIVGTLELLSVSERNRVKGIVFNKFRGDKSILKPGLDMLESRINKPVVGVIPYIHNLGVDDEDSVSLEYSSNNEVIRTSDIVHPHPNPPPSMGRGFGNPVIPILPSLGGRETEGGGDELLRNSCVDIVVIKLPRISNFTDFNTLTHEKDVRVRFVDKVENIGKPDLLIIPGTKNTISDLTFLRERGIFGEIIELSRQGTMTIGICGGYQMLGKQINDPHHVESSKDSIQGLGLLETITTFAREKQTYQVKARMLEHGHLFPVDNELVGYEIHMGETTHNGHNSVRPFARITERVGEMVDILDGCVSLNGNVMGTYIHGIFDNDEFRSKLIDYLRLKKGLRPSNGRCADFKTIKELRYNELADIVRRNINMNLVYSMMKSS